MEDKYNPENNSEEELSEEEDSKTKASIFQVNAEISWKYPPTPNNFPQYVSLISVRLCKLSFCELEFKEFFRFYANIYVFYSRIVSLTYFI